MSKEDAHVFVVVSRDNRRVRVPFMPLFVSLLLTPDNINRNNYAAANSTLLTPIACLQDHEGSSAVRSALRGGRWLLADIDEQGIIAEPGRRQLVPIKSVRGPGLRLDLSAEMGDCPCI